MDLPTDLLNKFQELIYGQCSLRFSPSRMSNLKTRLRERIKIRRLSSYEDYLKLLQEDTGELDTLIEGITTKETYFFRLPEQFHALTKEIVPRLEERLSLEAQKLLAQEGGPGQWKVPLRIWSAGCATGEEPYSIAMTIMNSLKYSRTWKVDILASDISKEAVTTASLGFYESKGLKKIPASYQKKYLKIVNGGAVVTDKLMKKVSFRIFNLRNLDMHNAGYYTFLRLNGNSESLYLAERFDIIFCRNVMIYFDFPAQQRLIDNLFACLKPGGYLFTGDAEPLHIYRHKLQTLECEGTYFYQKPENGNLPGRIKQNE